jgi:hypothetical protein
MNMQRRFIPRLSFVAVATIFASSALHAQSLKPMPSACDTAADLVDTIVDQFGTIVSQADAGYNDIYAPNTSNPLGVLTETRNKVFVPAGNRAGLTVKKIVLFGDSHGVDYHLVPSVSPAVQSIFKTADLVVGNLESPLLSGPRADSSGKAVQSNNFHMTRDYVKKMSAQLGIRPGKAIYTVANNHANDQGLWTDTKDSIQSFKTSVNPVDGKPFFYFTGVDGDVSNPTAMPPESPQATVADLGNFRVGVLGWTHVMNHPTGYTQPRWLTDIRAIQSEASVLGVKYYVPRNFNSYKTRNNLQFLIGLPHWDCQPYAFPKAETVDQTRVLLDQGMDIVSGAHQSTPAPVRIRYGYGSNTLAFYGMAQLYQNPGYLPNLSLVSEVYVDTTGKVLEYKVKPLIRFNIDSAKYANLLTTTVVAPVLPPVPPLFPMIQPEAVGYGKVSRDANGLVLNPEFLGTVDAPVSPSANVLMTLDEAAIFRTYNANMYNQLRSVVHSLPDLNDTTVLSGTVGTIEALNSNAKNAKSYYDFVKKYDRIKALVDLVYPAQ